MASTGLIAIALKVGANPASTPNSANKVAAPMAMPKEIWKVAPEVSSCKALSTNCKTITAKVIPLKPATRVSTMLSPMIIV